MTVPLSLGELEVRYGRHTVLDRVSLRVEPGTVLALLGRNGAGKSSLVRCALGLQRRNGGEALLFGEDVWRHRARLLQRVGVVPEEPDAPPDMTPVEISAFVGRFHERWDGADVERRLVRAGIPLKTRFGSLSKGQKGAVMLALALGSRRDLLVLDDPTLGLDAVARRGLYDELIGELADRGTSVLVTTHDLAGVEAIADHVAVLSGTHLALAEPMETLKARFRRLRCAAPGNDFTWAPFDVTTSVERPWGREAIVSNFDEDRLRAFRAAARSEVEVGGVSLEDVFVAVASDVAAAS